MVLSRFWHGDRVNFSKKSKIRKFDVCRDRIGVHLMPVPWSKSQEIFQLESFFWCDCSCSRNYESRLDCLWGSFYWGDGFITANFSVDMDPTKFHNSWSLCHLCMYWRNFLESCVFPGFFFRFAEFGRATKIWAVLNNMVNHLRFDQNLHSRKYVDLPSWFSQTEMTAPVSKSIQLEVCEKLINFYQIVCWIIEQIGLVSVFVSFAEAAHPSVFHGSSRGRFGPRRQNWGFVIFELVKFKIWNAGLGPPWFHRNEGCCLCLRLTELQGLCRRWICEYF